MTPEEQQWFEDRRTDLCAYPMDEPVIEVETVTVTGYRREIKKTSARFPFTK